VHVERLALADRVVHVLDTKDGVRLDRIAVGGITEVQRKDAEVDEVLTVDPPKRLRPHGTQPEEGGDQRTMFSRSSIARS
jgi:hypothetical protein